MDGFFINNLLVSNAAPNFKIQFAINATLHVKLVQALLKLSA